MSSDSKIAARSEQPEEKKRCDIHSGALSPADIKSYLRSCQPHKTDQSAVLDRHDLQIVQAPESTGDSRSKRLERNSPMSSIGSDGEIAEQPTKAYSDKALRIAASLSGQVEQMARSVDSSVSAIDTPKSLRDVAQTILNLPYGLFHDDPAPSQQQVEQYAKEMGRLNGIENIDQKLTAGTTVVGAGHHVSRGHRPGYIDVRDVDNRLAFSFFSNGEQSIFSFNDGSTYLRKNDGTSVSSDERVYPEAAAKVDPATGITTSVFEKLPLTVLDMPDGSGGLSLHREDGSSLFRTWSADHRETFMTEKTVDGRVITSTAGGSTTIEEADGTGFRRDPDGKEIHFGPHPEDNFSKLDVVGSVAVESAKLEKLIRGKDYVSSASKRERMLSEKENFLSLAQVNGFSDDTVARTFHQVSRLLETTASQIAATDRENVAGETLYHLANPQFGVNQGFTDTCPVTAMAGRMFERQPDKAAEMVASTAIDGVWRSPDGQLAVIDKQSLKPTVSEASFYDMPESKVQELGNRSYAVRLMTLSLANVGLQNRLPPESYRIVDPVSRGDTGERVYYADGKTFIRKNEKGDPDNTPYFDEENVGRQIFGNTRYLLRVGNPMLEDSVTAVDSKKLLVAKLRELQDSGEFPLIAGVDPNHPAIAKDDHADFKAGHALRIESFYPASGKVLISNQWGRKFDGPISVDELWEALSSHSYMKSS